MPDGINERSSGNSPSHKRLRVSDCCRSRFAVHGLLHLGIHHQENQKETGGKQ